MIPDFNNMIPELHYYIHRKCTPNWKIDANVIPFIDITYVIDGKAEYNIGGHIYIVKKGDLICIPQNTYRAAVNIPEDLMECYSTNIFLRDQFGQEARLPLPIISHIGIIPRLISRFHEIHEEWLQRDFGYMLKIRGILCLILYQISNLILNENHLSQEDPRIKNSIRYEHALSGPADHRSDGPPVPSPSRLLRKSVPGGHGDDLQAVSHLTPFKLCGEYVKKRGIQRQ